MAKIKMKVQLIFPKHDKGINLKDNYGYLVLPTGLEVIASVLERDNKDTDIEIFSEYMTAEEEIIKRLDGDIVGVTDWVTNHKSAMRLLKKAKERGAVTIAGGQYASDLGKRILKNCDFVDYVVFGSGEYAFSKLARGEKIQNVENIWYRENNQTKFTFLREVDLNTLPLFDFRHIIDLDIRDYAKKISERGPGEQVGVSFIRGCEKAFKCGRCSFCSLPIEGLKLMDVDRAWQQLIHLNRLYNLDFFQETGDSFNAGNYPQLFASAKPSNLNIKLRGNCTAPLTEKDTDAFKESGFVEFLMGLNHNDEDILNTANIKRSKRDDIEKSICLLKERGIGVKLSCMFGLPGETEKSVRGLCEYVNYLTKNYGVIVHLSWAQPTVGSPLFNHLHANKELAKEYNHLSKGNLSNDDIIDYELLIKLMTKHYSKINYERISGIVKEMTAYHPRMQF